MIVNLLELTQEGYDADYEVSRIQTFISEFKDKRLKKLGKEWNKKMKELEGKIEGLKLQLTSPIV